jgi:hypothetical protein
VRRIDTHGAVANKVQAVDGRWLSIDGRVLFKANIAMGVCPSPVSAGSGLRWLSQQTPGPPRDGRPRPAALASALDAGLCDALHEIALEEHKHQHQGQDGHRGGQEQLVQVDRLGREECAQRDLNGPH